MTTAKRYTIVECHNDDEVWFKMKEVAHGEYVLYSDYKELEQELSKLKESQTQKSIIKLCNRVDKAEQENFELKRAISFYYTNRKDSRNDGVPLEEFKKIWPMK